MARQKPTDKIPETSEFIITVFGSSKVEDFDPEYQKARELGRLLAESGYTICNGGYGGIMEASARGAKEAGGRAVGITADELNREANPWITEQRRVPTWRERLFALIDTGCAYVVCDGGTGTLVELFVVWEMLSKRLFKTPKPILILGSHVSNLAAYVRKMPQVISSPHLFLVKNPIEAVMLLKKY